MKKKHRLQSKHTSAPSVPSVEVVAAHVIPRNIVDEMQESYLDYAMSVIISRALPDVRDGLKPVHRRILYAMWDMGLKASAKFRKSATIIGECLGKYHPHGDISVYDALVRMAQDFSMRSPLVHGQGNFGSVDGDSAAAYRYTEAKLSKIAEELLYDIDKETVPFVPNYDGTHKEPTLLPAKLPNLLLNGTSGIAVGMATNIPPHNLGELCGAIIHLIQDPEADVDDLMEYVKGPDFPTGGIMYDIKALTQAYTTGRGGIVVRARTEIVEAKNGAFQILITEIPYQVNKSNVLEKIAELVQTKKIEGIRDLRDESNKEGIRVVIELKKDTYPKKILNQLFKSTQLQDTFHFNMVALVDGIQPRTLTLKSVLEEFIKHRKFVVVKRAEYDLAKARDRAHILEGLKMALDAIDAVIKTIKQSKDRDEAKANLMKKFRLSERQAIAILEMRLQQLANLERLKIEQELKEKRALIRELEALLGSPKKILGVVKEETEEIRTRYHDERRTQVVKGGVDKFQQEDLIPNESTIVVITRDGYIKRLPPDTFRIQERGGKGVLGLTTKEEDTVDHLFSCMTHNDLLFFTTRGRVFQLKAYDVPLASRTAKGQAIVNFLQLSANEKITAILSLADLTKYKFLMAVTKNGLTKKTDIEDFKSVRRSGLIAITLRDDDMLEWVKPTTGKDEVLMVTAQGQAIRFKESDVRAMGRTAAGVRAIRLKRDDVVVGMDIITGSSSLRDAHVLTVMEKGFGKRSTLKAYKVQGRGGSGIKTAKITAKTGVIVMARIVDPNNLPEGVKGDLLIMSEKGQVIRISVKSVSITGRATQGVRLMRSKESADKVASVTMI
ncbi:DNA gyrase subunit A [Candidatus Uhrbacteria bacterium]|nr:DNA gyrase subunit A [Candidatus Uhrbacteria bacterium]